MNAIIYGQTQALKESPMHKGESAQVMETYFKKVFELQKSGKPFPVHLDEVWPLVYSRKDKAVRALRKNTDFIEGFDYQLLPQNGEQDSEEFLLRQNGEQDSGRSHGGHNREDYVLSVSCLEFFIARKVRSVFEVYRQVFHQTATIKTKIKLYPHEVATFEVLAQWLRKGDIKRVAEQLEVTPGSVSRVKRGVFRSERIMMALLERCKFNMVHGITNGYSNGIKKLTAVFSDNQLTLAL